MRLLTLLAIAVGLAGPRLAAAQSDIGVVLMHGKQAMPGQPPGMAQLESELQRHGAKVVSPQMPWASGSWQKIDVTVEGAHALIDAQVSQLRARGARRIVVAGHSIGANVALSYAVARPDVAAIVMISPGHSPSFSARTMPDYVAALEKAAALVQSGQGAQAFTGPDNNQGRKFDVSTTAEIYQSWMSPRRAANMANQAPLLSARIPVLVLMGDSDPAASITEGSIYRPAAKHPYSKYLAVAGDHGGAIGGAVGQVAAWVAGLPQ
ncbi:MAG: alpha/beta fold hydrolase [Reyranellaceae bacterium]